MRSMTSISDARGLGSVIELRDVVGATVDPDVLLEDAWLNSVYQAAVDRRSGGSGLFIATGPAISPFTWPRSSYSPTARTNAGGARCRAGP